MMARKFVRSPLYQVAEEVSHSLKTPSTLRSHVTLITTKVNQPLQLLLTTTPSFFCTLRKEEKILNNGGEAY
jgi:hypothetical protein